MADEENITIKETKKKSGKRKPLPMYKVLLHNDKVNDFGQVVKVVYQLTPLKKEECVQRVTEAHETGVSLLLVTHKERAELYEEQFRSNIPPIKVTIEPDE